MDLHFSNVETVEVTSKVGGPEMVVILPTFPLSDSQTVSFGNYPFILFQFFFFFFFFLGGGNTIF